METVTASELKAWLDARDTLAFLDVREPGEFGLRHPFLAVPLPYSRFELELPRLVPSPDVPLVLADEDGAIARLAAGRARALGYRRVLTLDGGLQAWRQAGYKEFAGVHVPSKAFGELVEARCGTPQMDAGELARRLAGGERMHLFDARPPAEFHQMSIPGARCCPNGELPYRWEALIEDSQTPVVVNCAGRTRGIIGAQTLVELGVPNPVYSLRNGTMGWQLAGLERAHGANDVVTITPPPGPSPGWRERIRALAASAGVTEVCAATVAGWQRAGEAVYCFDVRLPASADEPPLPGTRRAPSVQLIQATEAWIGVRTARVVLADDDGLRARLCAYWLRLMGYDAHVLAYPETSNLPHTAKPPRQAELRRCSAAAAIAEQQAATPPLLLDTRSSEAYRQGHPCGTRWLIRPRLTEVVPALLRSSRGARLIADDTALAGLVAGDLADRGIEDVALVEGGAEAWRAQGGAWEVTPERPCDRARIDRLFFVHDRHHGNLDAARRYLEWEQGLVAQLDAAELREFRRLTTGQ